MCTIIIDSSYNFRFPLFCDLRFIKIKLFVKVKLFVSLLGYVYVQFCLQRQCPKWPKPIGYCVGRDVKPYSLTHLCSAKLAKFISATCIPRAAFYAPKLSPTRTEKHDPYLEVEKGFDALFEPQLHFLSKLRLSPACVQLKIAGDKISLRNGDDVAVFSLNSERLSKKRIWA